MNAEVLEELKRFAVYVETHLGHIIDTSGKEPKLLDTFRDGKLAELYVKLRENKIL